MVVWATDYRRDYSWLYIPGPSTSGWYTRPTGTTEGLHLLGLTWQTSRGSSLLSFVGRDVAVLLNVVPDDDVVGLGVVELADVG